MAAPHPKPRVAPYTYLTWLSKAIAGEHMCLYAGWFKSHFSLQAPKRDANLDAWTAEHTAMVHDVAAEYRSAEYEVYVEGQNTLRVRGQGGVLVGKPDIVAVKGDTAIVIDCKTGNPRTSDSLQVRLYMYLLGEWSTHPARGCRRILGEVRYKPDRGDTLYLPHAAADGVADLMKRYMQVFLSPTPPPATPSFGDCRFCELAGGVCLDAVEEESEAVVVGWL